VPHGNTNTGAGRREHSLVASEARGARYGRCGCTPGDLDLATGVGQVGEDAGREGDGRAVVERQAQVLLGLAVWGDAEVSGVAEVERSLRRGV
jgi:hypothetical protein